LKIASEILNIVIQTAMDVNKMTFGMAKLTGLPEKTPEKPFWSRKKLLERAAHKKIMRRRTGEKLVKSRGFTSEKDIFLPLFMKFENMAYYLLY